MKLSHKLLVVSTAALIVISPVISASQPLLVHAANKASKKGTIKLSHNAYVFDKTGKRLETYMGSAKNTKIGKGQTLKYKGKTTINGKDYFDIGGNAFVKVANVGFVDGKKVAKTSTATAKIKHNAYIYDAKGKTDKKKVKKGQTVTVDQSIYIGKKLYYRISSQSNQFIKTANVGKLTGAKLKPVNDKPGKNDGPVDNQNDPTVITLSHNAYIYDGEGHSTKKLLRVGEQIQVDKLQYIGKKLYYHVSDSKYPGDDQWVKKNNVGVITGKQLKPANAAPVADQTVTIATLARNANVYNNKGVVQTTKTFAKGHTARVSEMRYIWVESENKAELFYKLQSDKNGYLKGSDIATISGAKLTPVNTPETAKDEAIVASATDKKGLQDAITEDSKVKTSDAYKLSAKSLRDAYDAAMVAGTQVNSAVSSVSQVNAALAKINTAKAALNGKKVIVQDLKNLTLSEADQIVQVAATANGVDKSAVKFSNNNTVLTISNANGFEQTLNIADYAATAAPVASTTPVIPAN